MKSYEHSKEVELAWPNIDCVKSVVLYTSYELGDSNSDNVRERKNGRPVTHTSSQCWESAPLWAAFGIIFFCLKERFYLDTVALSQFLLSWIHRTELYLTCPCESHRERERWQISRLNAMRARQAVLVGG